MLKKSIDKQSKSLIVSFQYNSVPDSEIYVWNLINNNILLKLTFV